MKKLLLLNSFFILIALTSLSGCRAKKKVAEESVAVGQEVVEEKKQEVVETETQQDRVIRAPGTINQGALDSIKAVRMKEKLKYKK